MAQLVTISHPDIDGQAVVTLDAVPGYAARGWLVTDQVLNATVSAVAADLTRPAGNAATTVWRTYAVASVVLGTAGNLTFDQAMTASRDELAAHFTSLPDPAAPAENPDPATTEES